MKLIKKVYNDELSNPMDENEFRMMLLHHFDYSIKDIKSYDELTDEEKKIVPKRIFDMVTEQ